MKIGSKVALWMSLAVAATTLGCASSEAPTSEGENPASAQPSAPGAPTAAVPAASATTSEHGTLLRTVATSAATRSSTGITTWGIFKKGAVTSMVGFDSKGIVLTQLAAAITPDGSEMKIGAPGAGVLHQRRDGTTISTTLTASRIPALKAMRADSAAAKGETAYALSCEEPWIDIDSYIERIWECFPDGTVEGDEAFCSPQPMPLPPICNPLPAPPIYCTDNVCPNGGSKDDNCNCQDPWADWTF